MDLGLHCQSCTLQDRHIHVAHGKIINIIIYIIIHPLNFGLGFLQLGAPNSVLGLSAYQMQFQNFVIKFKSLTTFLGKVWRWKKNNILCQNKNFTT